ncbi:hypothetical protein N7449_005887, partial [Penicillium cf. viridicatum]
RKKTPLSLLSTVLFDRDPDFVDRLEILKQIYESISKLGGVYPGLNRVSKRSRLERGSVVSETLELIYINWSRRS